MNVQNDISSRLCMATKGLSICASRRGYFRHSVRDCSIYDMKPMSKQTRRDFLAMTTASAACLPFTKSFSLATPTPPREQTPGGTVAVHLTTRDQRYSPS